MAWYENAVFYHIYPLGLCGCPHNNEGEAGECFDKLNAWAEHARELGCNAVYIGPLFESDSHGYDTTDYRLVDRRLGTNDDFAKFVENCHEKGMKVIVDGVFNHTGRGFFAFEDIRKNRETSRYKDWYCNVNFGGNTEYNDGFSYENWGGYNLLAKLNLWNPEVKQYHMDTVRFWVETFDIDGIRLDAADVLDFGFMRELRTFTNGLKPEFWLMGEVIHGDYSRWANSDMLHSVTNYELHKGLYSGHNDHNYFEIAHTVKRLLGIVRDTRLYTFSDNHDVARLASKLNNRAHMKHIAMLVYTLPGIPSIYYGSEFGIEGPKDPHSDWNLRPELFLSDFDEQAELPSLYRTLGRLRQTYPELSFGDYRELYLTTGQYAFARTLNGRAIVTVLNNADNGAHMEMNLPAAANRAVNLLTVQEGKEETKQVSAEDAASQAWENAKNALLDKAGQLVGASGEIRCKSEDIRRAISELLSGAAFGPAIWNLFGNLQEAMNNMHRVIGEFEAKMHESESGYRTEEGFRPEDGAEVRDGKLIVDLPANQGMVLLLEN